MKEVKLTEDVFLIKLEDGKVKIKNPHGEEAAEKYKELRDTIERLCLPKENKSNE